MPASIIGSIVKEEAKRRGITLVQLSNLVGVSYAHLRAVLKGVYVSRPVVRKISRILDLPDLPERYEQFLHELKSGGAKGG